MDKNEKIVSVILEIIKSKYKEKLVTKEKINEINNFGLNQFNNLNTNLTFHGDFCRNLITKRVHDIYKVKRTKIKIGDRVKVSQIPDTKMYDELERVRNLEFSFGGLSSNSNPFSKCVGNPYCKSNQKPVEVYGLVNDIIIFGNYYSIVLDGMAWWPVIFPKEMISLV